MPAQIRDYIFASENLALINVTAAEGSTLGNGHGYFRSSPWVSSDFIALLLHDLAPEQRGLVRTAEDPIWSFPDDYPDKVRAAAAAARGAP